MRTKFLKTIFRQWLLFLILDYLLFYFLFAQIITKNNKKTLVEFATFIERKFIHSVSYSIDPLLGSMWYADVWIFSPAIFLSVCMVYMCLLPCSILRYLLLRGWYLEWPKCFRQKNRVLHIWPYTLIGRIAIGRISISWISNVQI